MIAPATERELRDQVARRLHVRRAWLRMTQQELADKAGVSRNFVSAIECSAQGLDAWRLTLLALALNIPFPHLLTGPDPLAEEPLPGCRA